MQQQPTMIAERLEQASSKIEAFIKQDSNIQAEQKEITRIATQDHYCTSSYERRGTRSFRGPINKVDCRAIPVLSSYKEADYASPVMRLTILQGLLDIDSRPLRGSHNEPGSSKSRAAATDGKQIFDAPRYALTQIHTCKLRRTGIG